MKHVKIKLNDDELASLISGTPTIALLNRLKRKQLILKVKIVSDKMSPNIVSSPVIVKEQIDNINDGQACKTMEQTYCETVLRTLKKNGFNRKKTSEDLRISERTLYRKLKRYKEKSMIDEIPE